MNIQQPQSLIRNDLGKVQQAIPIFPQQQPAAAVVKTDEQPTKVAAEEVEKSVREMQKQMDTMRDAHVSFEFNGDIDRVILKFIQSDGQLVKQIPSKDFVEFQKEFVKMTGLLLDKKA